MENRKSVFYKIIARYIFEIILIVSFMVVSYSGFTMNNLSEASKIASVSSKETRDIYIMYARLDEDSVVRTDDNIVDRGVLSLKNPNKTAKSMSVVMQLQKSDAYDIGDISITFDGEDVGMGVIMNLDQTYEVILGTVELEAYEYCEKNIVISDIEGSVPLEYSFKIVGSF